MLLNGTRHVAFHGRSQTMTEKNALRENELKGKKLFPFVAPPSGGKGTQTAALLKTYPDKLGKFDMGATFRTAVKDPENPLGQKIRESMKAGQLVDISIVMQLFEKGLKAEAEAQPNLTGFILDGFPRNVEQLENLLLLCEKEGASVAQAFYLDVPEQVIIDRSAGRAFCNHCNEPFNLRIKGMDVHPCAVAKRDITPADTDDFYQREDDAEATVRKRLQSFSDETQPMIDLFRKKDLLSDVDGNRAPEEITSDMLSKMKGYLKEEAPSTSSGMSKVLMTLLLAIPFALAIMVRLFKG